jgi:hypothetical protein
MKELAQIGLISIYSLTIVFHLLVLMKVIPYKIVWGSRLKTDSDMYKLETVSVILNVFFLIVILSISNYIPFTINDSVLTVLLWIMAALFLFNTVVNMLSKNRLEKLIFTPVTIILTILTVVLIVS